MHPNALVLRVVALAGVVVSTKNKPPGPSCPEQEYYNKMMESKNRKAAVTDCAKWLDGTAAGVKDIPKYFNECSGDQDEERISRVSAACSCIATPSVGSTASRTVIVTTSSSASSSHPASTSSVSSSVASTSEHTPIASSNTASHPSSSASGPTDTTFSGTGSHITSMLTTASSLSQTSQGTTTPTSSLSTHISSSQSVHASFSESQSTPGSSTSHSSFSPTVSQSTRSSTTEIHSTTTDHTTTIGSANTHFQKVNTHMNPTQSASVPTTGSSIADDKTGSDTTQSNSGRNAGSTKTGSFPTQPRPDPLQSAQSTVIVPESTITSLVPAQASPSLTTSTIYTESVFTVTSCAPSKTNCPAASTVLVTSTIALSTTVCPVTEASQPDPSSWDSTTTTKRVTSTLYSTTTYTLTRCPPGATYCPVGNIPITATVPIGTTTLTYTGAVPTGEQSTQSVAAGNDNKEEGTPTHTGGQTPTSYTVINVPTTIHTIMNGVSAQILTVVPVTLSALPAGKDASSVPTPSHSQASPSDAPFDSKAWQPTQPGNQTTVKGSTSSRLPVVTAGAPGFGGSDGVRFAFLVAAVALFF